MDTADIEIFLTLAEELHFGRTAERLHLAQPRVTRVIAALEGRAGGNLFDRTSRRSGLPRSAHGCETGCSPPTPSSSRHSTTRGTRPGHGRRTADRRYPYYPGGGADPPGVGVRGRPPRLPRRPVRGRLQPPVRGAAQAAGRVLVNWLALDEPDLTAGPAIDYRERVLAVGASHPFAKRRTVELRNSPTTRTLGFTHHSRPRWSTRSSRRGRRSAGRSAASKPAASTRCGPRSRGATRPPDAGQRRAFPPRRHRPGPHRGPAAAAARADLVHRPRERPDPSPGRHRPPAPLRGISPVGRSGQAADPDVITVPDPTDSSRPIPARSTPAHPGESEAGITKDPRNGYTRQTSNGRQATPA